MLDAMDWCSSLVTGPHQRRERQRAHARAARASVGASAARVEAQIAWWEAVQAAAAELWVGQAAAEATVGSGSPSVKLATDRVRQSVWRLPVEDFVSTEELHGWSIKRLSEELHAARARAPRRVSVEQPSHAPLDKEDLVAAVELARGGEGARSCAICVDDFERGDTLRVLGCGHRYHLECVDRWLLNAERECACPMCKAPL